MGKSKLKAMMIVLLPHGENSQKIRNLKKFEHFNRFFGQIQYQMLLMSVYGVVYCKFVQEFVNLI